MMMMMMMMIMMMMMMMMISRPSVKPLENIELYIMINNNIYFAKGQLHQKGKSPSKQISKKETKTEKKLLYKRVDKLFSYLVIYND